MLSGVIVHSKRARALTFHTFGQLKDVDKTASQASENSGSLFPHSLPLLNHTWVTNKLCGVHKFIMQRVMQSVAQRASLFT